MYSLCRRRKLLIPEWIPRLLIAAAALTAAAMQTLFYIHMLQLNSYYPSRFFRWMQENPGRVWSLPHLLCAPALLTLFLAPEAGGIAAALWLFFCAALCLPKKAKKPLVFTARVKRLLTTTALLWIVLCALLWFLPRQAELCCLILPLFAFTNAQVRLVGVDLGSIVLDPVTQGAYLGAVLGKPLGIILVTLLLVKIGFARLPHNVTWDQIVAVGIMGGIPKMAERISGRINPTAVPYCQPQIKAQRNTGRCMGSSILPICWICPVKNGSTSPRAKNMADSSIFFKERFIPASPSCFSVFPKGR